jgi:hypothetical protein
MAPRARGFFFSLMTKRIDVSNGLQVRSRPILRLQLRLLAGLFVSDVVHALHRIAVVSDNVLLVRGGRSDSLEEAETTATRTFAISGSRTGPG